MSLRWYSVCIAFRDGWAQVPDGWAQVPDGWAQIIDDWAQARSGPPLATPLNQDNISSTRNQNNTATHSYPPLPILALMGF